MFKQRDIEKRQEAPEIEWITRVNCLKGKLKKLAFFILDICIIFLFYTMIIKIVSGGQTGVDRAALDSAIQREISHGGWCPKGRLAEDGPLDQKYRLKETFSSTCSERTRLNVRDSDGTLIGVPENLEGIQDGTLLTLQEAQACHKPFFIFDLYSHEDTPVNIAYWIEKNKMQILNIAGPRES